MGALLATDELKHENRGGLSKMRRVKVGGPSVQRCLYGTCYSRHPRCAGLEVKLKLS